MSGRPTKEQAAEIAQRILDGARLVFCEHGVAGTSIDEIAARLKLSKHTIYRRYPNKAAILEAVAERDIHRFKHELAQASAGAGNALDALRKTAHRYVEIGSSRDYAAFYLGVMAEAVRSEPLRRQLAAWAAISLQPIVLAIVGAQRAGVLKEGDPAAVTAILIDLLEGVNNHMRLGEVGRNRTAIMTAQFDLRWVAFIAIMAPAGATAQRRQKISGVERPRDSS